MARQNVGTPKFYVDLIQYWHAKGIVAGIGPYGDSSGPFANTDFPDVCPEGLIDQSDGSGWKPELIGFNPYSYMHNGRTFNTDGEGVGYLNHLLCLKEKVLLPESGTMFMSYLNHNFDSCGVALGVTPLIELYKSYNNWLDEGNNFTYGVEQMSNMGGACQVTADSLTSICNMDDSIGYNGFSIAEFDSTNLNECNEIEELDPPAQGNRGFDTMIWNIYSTTFNSNTDAAQFALGSFNFGQVYTMPHSPDLSLTMTREFDGIEKQETRGGSTLTQISYDGPPRWRDNLGAWELHNTDEITNKKYLFRDKMTRGRRVWSLKFSYLSSDDLFSPTELYTYAHASDIENSDAGYSSSDFNDGFFENNFNNDNSFMSVVMSRTMGGKLPFMFQPDSNNNAPDQFAICELDQDSISFKQVAHNVYDVSLKIREVW